MKIDKLCILDTETGGLDPKTCPTVEIAVCLYDIEHASPIATFSSLIQSETNEAELVNNIPVSLLQSCEFSNTSIWNVILDIASKADVVVAHRAEFDIQFVPKHLQTLKPWACSKFDMVWPEGNLNRGDHLVHLALAHGVPVYSAHRALADVDTLVRTFQAAQAIGYDVRNMVEESLKPKAVFKALVPYERRDEAKRAGFTWDADKKIWTRRIFLHEADKFAFKVQKL